MMYVFLFMYYVKLHSLYLKILKKSTIKLKVSHEVSTVDMARSSSHSSCCAAVWCRWQWYHVNSGGNVVLAVGCWPASRGLVLLIDVIKINKFPVWVSNSTLNSMYKLSCRLSIVPVMRNM